MMVAGSIAILTALVYVCALFVVAHYGDTAGPRILNNRTRPVVYALTLGVYCTSWTFFGSVGLATSHGLDFLPIYIGPFLVVGLFYPFILRIVRLAKAQNITSVADFVAARYGKSEQVAALVAIIMVIGVVPYIALQLKAISASISTVLGSIDEGHAVVSLAVEGILPVVVALLLAGFAMAFGTRHIDATEHQDGLVLAIAAESVVKLVAFLIVGAYVTWGMFGGFNDLAQKAIASEPIRQMLSQTPPLDTWLTTTLLAGCCILLLPRQFQMMVVENRDERDVKTAAWLFPLYLVLINIFVIPLAIAGLLMFPGSGFDRDMTVLALPLEGNAAIVALITMVGGLSAATAMVIVESVALSIMVSNDLVMPILLRGSSVRSGRLTGNLGSVVLVIRRLAILLMLGLGYIYFRYAGEAALAAIGLLSFAAVAQIAPAFIGGLFWSRATSRGAIGGLLLGIGTWAYTLLLPSVASGSPALSSLVEYGPLGIAALKPTALFGTEAPSLVHGVFWSLALNLLGFVGFSLSRHTSPIERLQADIFIGHSVGPMGQAFRLWGVTVTVSELESTVARYLGAEPTRRAFEGFMSARGLEIEPAQEADIQLLRFAEHQLASAIGAASSRLVVSLLLRRRNVSREAALRMIDQASATLQYNRDLLQHALDFARQGITVFDRDLRLICWNREFRDLFDLSPDILRLGLGLEELVRYNAERGLYGEGPADEFVAKRLEAVINEFEPFRLRLYPSTRVIEIRSARMPDGGLVTTYTDVTDTVEAEEALERTNETLEQRVRQRTDELVQLNGELERAKAEADDANLSKTRFLAAASHDILQPLNAARLYATSLVERMQQEADGVSAPQSIGELVHHLDASLESVEEILTALLEISRLDAGAMKAEPSSFRIDDLLGQLRIEFGPMASRKGLKLTFVPCGLSVRSDRRLLRRLLQNLISNAIKYTPSGRVLVGCRRRGDILRVQVLDTGMGIPQSQQINVFREFERLAPAAKSARGLGLGLSIVERIARVLETPIRLQSTVGKGTVFSVDVGVTRETATVGQADPALDAALRNEPLAGLCVLAIDNEPRILEGMQALLGGWGCRIICAADLAEAERKLDETQLAPDVVIADYHLDDSDGLSVIAALRARFGDDLPALLATADRSPEVRDQAGEKDIRVLNKPVRPAALRAMLSQWRVSRRAAE